MNRMDEVRGTVTIFTQVGYKKPGQEGTTWHKVVMLYRDMHVTMEQAQETLDRWKQANPECVGEFRAALY
jgi:hypothetical protein